MLFCGKLKDRLGSIIDEGFNYIWLFDLARILVHLGCKFNQNCIDVGKVENQIPTVIHRGDIKINNRTLTYLNFRGNKNLKVSTD